MNTSNDQAGVLELAQLVADLGSTKPEVPERAATLLHKKAKLTQQHATMANTPGLIAGLLRVAGSGSSSSGSSSSGSSSSGSSSGSNSTDAAKMAAMTAVVDICWNARKEEVWQEEPALVQQLVDLASSQHPEVQVRALKALWYLAMVPANSRLIAEVGGAIPMLAGFLSSSGTKWAPSAATRVLWHVSQERTAAQRIAETPGAVQALLGLLGAGDKPLQQKLAADTLCNLAQSEFTAQQQGTIRGLVVLPLLVEMLKSEAPGVQLAAADVVVQLVTREPSCRQRLAQEPGLMEGFMDAVDRGGKQLPVGTQEQAQAAVELLLEEATRKEVTHADVTQQAPRTRLILPLLPLVVGSCLLLAGPLLVVYGLLAAGTASAAPSSHNTDLLVVTGGVWALVKGAALVAASVTTAVTHHLTLLADSLERCLTRGSMVAGGVWLLRGGMYVVAAGAKVLTADHCPNQGTRLLLATSTLIAAAAGLCVVAVGVWLLSEALGAPFPWSAGRALLGHCKEAVKQVSSTVAAALRRALLGSLLAAAALWQLRAGLVALSAGLATLGGLAEAIISGVPLPDALYAAQLIIGRHAMTLIVCSVVVGFVQVACVAHMAATTLLSRAADRKWLLLTVHVAVAAGRALLLALGPSATLADLWLLLGVSLVAVAVQWMLLTRPGQVAAGWCLILHGAYSCILAFLGVWQVFGGHGSIASARSTHLVLPLVTGSSAVATGWWVMVTVAGA